MKYLAIALMPTKHANESFKLNDVLTCSYQALSTQLNQDQCVSYQMSASSTLKDSYDFLQILNIERDSTVYTEENIFETPLKYVVLAVTDDMDTTKPLEDYTREIFLYYPDNHINLALSVETDHNEAILNDCMARTSALEGGEEMSLVDQEVLERRYLTAIENQEALEAAWKAYMECPLQSFKGPQFEAGFAATPVMSRIEVVDEDSFGSPVLVRENAMMDAMGLFGHRVRREVLAEEPERLAFEAELMRVDALQNSNNNNNEEPSSVRHRP